MSTIKSVFFSTKFVYLESVVGCGGLEAGDGGEGLVGAVRHALTRTPLARTQGRTRTQEVTPDNEID